MSYTVIITEEISANVDVTTQNYPITIEYNATTLTDPGTYGNSNVVGLLANLGSNSVSTTGNVTAGYFVGDGSLLTNLPAGNYNNANVAAFLAAFGSNVISTTGNITAGVFAGNAAGLSAIPGANVTGTVANATYATSAGSASTATLATYATTANAVAGANVSGTVANAAYALTANAASYATNAVQANVANVANSVTGANVSGTVNLAQFVTQAAQANITSLGTLTGLAVTGNASATGNVTGGNLITTGIVYTPQVEAAVDLDLNVTGKVNVNGNLRVGDNNTDTQISTHGNANLTLKTDNANSANIVVRWGTNANIDLVPHGTGQTNITGGVSATGNVTAPYFLGNGSQLTGLPSGYGNADVATFLASFGSNTISTTGNITAGYFVGNGSQLTGLPSGYGNADVATFLAAFGSNSISTTGTITAGNFVGSGAALTTLTAANVTGTVGLAQFVTQAAQANITSVGTLTGLTVSGNAAVGNLLVVGNTASGTGNLQIATAGTANTFNPDASTTSVPVDGRIVIGSGSAGNLSLLNDPLIGGGMRGSRLLVYDRFVRNNQAYATRAGTFWSAIDLTANVTQANTRMQALGGLVAIGGGASANTFLPATSTSMPLTVSGGQFNVYIGNNAAANLALGNTQVSHTAINGGVLTVASGSTVGNASGMFVFTVNSGTVNNLIGYSLGYTGGGTAPGNVYSFYHPGNTITVAGNVNNTLRQAANYYAFFNEDDHAQVRLGSVRRQHEYRHDLGTTGNVSIDKTNGQVQYIRPTGNVTITGFSNFVTETYDGSTYDQQTDTVTIVIAQGATPYTITMPTGNTAIKYSAGIATVANTANAVTMISVTAANVASTKTYMVTISSEFT